MPRRHDWKFSYPIATNDPRPGWEDAARKVASDHGYADSETEGPTLEGGRAIRITIFSDSPFPPMGDVEEALTEAWDRLFKYT